MQIHSFFVRMLRTNVPARQVLPAACNDASNGIRGVDHFGNLILPRLRSRRPARPRRSAGEGHLPNVRRGMVS
jgi:hypothetical protein